jgi:hypothetical protein
MSYILLRYELCRSSPLLQMGTILFLQMLSALQYHGGHIILYQMCSWYTVSHLKIAESPSRRGYKW